MLCKSQTTHYLMRRWLGRDLIQGKIQFQNVDSGLAQESELSAFSVLANRFANNILAQTALFGDARHLKFRRFRRDVRIEARSRGG